VTYNSKKGLVFRTIKMKNKNLRITIRVETKDREKIDLLVEESKVKSISHAIRTALDLYLKNLEAKNPASK